MKFFKWVIDLKIKDLTSEDKIIYLANKLIDELQKNGHTLRSQVDYAAVSIHCYRVDGENANVDVSNIYNGDFETVRGKLTTKIK